MKTKQNNKVVIIDGSSILTDAYYKNMPEELSKAKTEEEKEEAFKLLEKNENGQYIGAIRGLFATIFDAVDKLNPTHITVVWGASRKNNIRKEIYPSYKSDMNTMDEPLREQFKTAQVLLSPLVKQFTSSKYEAIDLAGTIADKLKSKAEVSILARNNNYLQLVDIATVYMKTSSAEKLIEENSLDASIIPNGYFKYTKDTLKYVKDLEPIQVLGFNALIGNTSSKVPGVKGVGATTALPVIKKFSTIENLYYQIENLSNSELISIWKDIGVRNPTKKLIENKENAFISNKLLSIIKDVYVEDEDINDIQNVITLDRAAIELSKIGLLSELYVSGTNESIKPVNLFDLISFEGTTNIKPTFNNKIASFSSLELNSDYNLENEFVSLSTIENSDKDFYSIKVSSPSILLSNDWDYIDYEEDYSEDEYYSDSDEYSEDYQSLEDDYIDDAGVNCEVEIVTAKTKGSTTDNKGTNIEDNNETISLIETIIIKKYRCNCCNNIFQITSDTQVNFCIHCGSKNSSNKDIKIDNLEDTGMKIDDIKINNNIESVMEYI